MSQESTARVKFRSPPVVEVVCGVMFGTEKPIRGAHVGRYWQEVEDNFSEIEEAPPILPIVENLGAPTFQEFGFSLGGLPPLRRTWLLNRDGRSIIQLQSDRFLFNWKKGTEADSYTNYEAISEQFELLLAGFIGFLEKENIGRPNYRQFELSYINHIPVGVTVNGFKVNEGKIFVDHMESTEQDRFLPVPESVNWQSVYLLPNQEGRLYAIGQSALSPKGERLARLDMIARGMSTVSSEDGRKAWFDQAHIWITKGFADLTASDIQTKVWERLS